MFGTVMRNALALIADPSMLEAVSRQVAPLAIECAFAFEAPDFWDMLAAARYDIVIAERASFAIKAASFVARVKRLRPGSCLLLIGHADDDDDRVSCRRTAWLELPLAEGALARALTGETRSEETDLITPCDRI